MQNLAQKAREALEKARNYPIQGGYNDGYLNGYADALREVAGLQYYGIRKGQEVQWKWLTEEEAAQYYRDGYTVVK